MTAPARNQKPDQLNAAEAGIIMSLIRVELRKTERSRAKLQEKLGDDYDPAQQNRRIEFLESAYRKLGGDPTNITRRLGRV